MAILFGSYGIDKKLQLQQSFGILKSLGLVIRPEPDFAALVDHCHPIQDRRPSSTAPSLSLSLQESGGQYRIGKEREGKEGYPTGLPAAAAVK